MKFPLITACSLVLALGATTSVFADSIERGRYLVAIGGCNDCHTAGFAQLGERIPESERLAGDAMGFAGPWGVSYPKNLRLGATQSDETAWLARARAGGLPPMPWGALGAMTDDDLRSVYRYLKSLGATGVPAPDAVAPGKPVATPYISFVPLPPDAVAAH